MKIYNSIFCGALVAMLCSNCVKVDITPILDSLEEPNVVTLQLKSSDVVVTKASGEYSEDVENIINGFQCFFVDDDENIIYYTENILDPNPNSEIGVSSKLENYKLEVPAEIYDDIKDGCTLYVVANNTEIELDETPTLSELMAKSAKALIATPDSFVMVGYSGITVDEYGKVSGTVSLDRLAAKIKVTVNLDKTVKVGTQTWTSDPTQEGTSMEFVGLSATTLGAAESNTNLELEVDSEMMTVTSKKDDKENVIGYTITQDVPFYTYPISWTTTQQKYIKLYIPWQSGSGSYATYEYQIPVNFDGCKLESNHFYDITVNVGVVGGLTEPVALTPSYYVMDWGTGEVNTDLSRPKYLVVEENYVEIYNQNSYSINYYASDPVTVTKTSVQFDSYKYATTRHITINSSNTTVTPSATGLVVADKWNDYQISNQVTEGNDGIFTFNHEMSSNTFVPHYIYITVSTEFFTENVTIVQYPPIYIKSDLSNGKVYVNAYSYSGNDSYRNVKDDNGIGIGSISDPDSITGDDNGTNVNQNMYNVYITSLPSSNANVIGDPRVSEGGDLSGINELTNYRATRSDAVNILAPAFKIASSYGKTVVMTYAGAQNRCASYQEDGYPAGRWRIPTRAEIEFMQERALNGDIPSLFNGIYSTDRWGTWQYSTGYWSADGYVYWPDYDSDGDEIGWKTPDFYSPTEMNSTNQSVRCVYDIWYWGEDNVQSALTKATWGDAKTNDKL